jgi:hypothetical protein
MTRMAKPDPQEELQEYVFRVGTVEDGVRYTANVYAYSVENAIQKLTYALAFELYGGRYLIPMGVHAPDVSILVEFNPDAHTRDHIINVY